MDKGRVTYWIALIFGLGCLRGKPRMKAGYIIFEILLVIYAVNDFLETVRILA